jgi:hypothetical protein
MQQQKQLLKGIESLSETQKMEIFTVEELEARLEMIEVSTDCAKQEEQRETNPNIPPDLPCNDSCWWD